MMLCDVCLYLLQRRKEEERHKVNVQKEKERYQEKLWAFISKKEIPKVRDMWWLSILLMW